MSLDCSESDKKIAYLEDFETAANNTLENHPDTNLICLGDFNINTDLNTTSGKELEKICTKTWFIGHVQTHLP